MLKIIGINEIRRQLNILAVRLYKVRYESTHEKTTHETTHENIDN